jgi:excisionase family DNA binding protein
MTVRNGTATHEPEQLVYFIQGAAGGPIKIGVAHTPEQRLRELQVGHPTALVIRKVMPGGVAYERELHTRFARARLCGEWFRPTDELCRFAVARGVASPEIEEARAEGFQLGYATGRRDAAARPSALTARAVADLLGVSTETVLRWTRRGEIPAFRLPGGSIRYRPEDISAWIADRSLGATERTSDAW